MDYRAELLAMIERLVGGAWDVPVFERAYYTLYVDRVPWAALTPREHDFFGEVQERLDWTDPAPDAESRAYGWEDHAEYRARVARLLGEFRAGARPAV